MLAVATYNVHSCIGIDGRHDPGRVATVIRGLEADIIALQEVDARDRPSGYLDQWTFLGAATGTQAIPGISLRTHRNLFGNALLSRHPVRAVRLHDLSVSGREPRGAIDADIEIDGRVVRIVATHLGLRQGERRRQAEFLLKILAHTPVEVGPPRVATLVLGDLNEWRRGAKSSITSLIRWSGAPPTSSPASFPARYPLLPLDRVLIHGGLALVECRVDRSPVARKASDHLPVRATLRWLPEGARA